ncbi:MAG TPA: hypothetical protein PKH07_15910 [bacterium]|nr:hypothetical protein [bacterium]
MGYASGATLYEPGMRSSAAALRSARDWKEYGQDARASSESVSPWTGWRTEGLVSGASLPFWHKLPSNSFQIRLSPGKEFESIPLIY